MTMGSRIIVIVNDGAVFAHDIIGNSVGVPVRLSGPPVASNSWDRWVLTLGSRILVVLNDGAVFAHDVTGNTVSPAVGVA